MTDMETRVVSAEFEVRATGKQRLLSGVIVPFGVNQRIDEVLTERFERGAFKHQVNAASRVPLLARHSNDAGHMQIGYGKALREDPGGLWAEFRVTPGPWGDQYLGLIEEGQARQWSIGFRTEARRMDGRVTVRTKATLFETALVPEGAYGELAAVGAVRAKLPTLYRDTILARLPAPRFPM